MGRPIRVSFAERPRPELPLRVRAQTCSPSMRARCSQVLTDMSSDCRTRAVTGPRRRLMVEAEAMTAVGMAEGTTDEAAAEDTRRTVAADVMTATVAVEVVTIVAVTVADTVRRRKTLLPEHCRRAFRKEH